MDGMEPADAANVRDTSHQERK